MFSFLGHRKDKKSTGERETDGGFVIIGETVEEQRQKMQNMNIVQPSTYVIVQPSKSSCVTRARPAHTVTLPPALPAMMPTPGPSAVDAAPSLSELLGDIPFTLAPHVLAVQAGFPFIPDTLLSHDINHNLANFTYDFTLENSVLCDL